MTHILEKNTDSVQNTGLLLRLMIYRRQMTHHDAIGSSCQTPNFAEQ